MILLLLGFFLLLPLPALAQFVDPMYGNPKFPSESYRPMPGGAAYRDLDGRTHYEYVRPSDAMPQSAPSMSPSMPVQPPVERYEFLQDRTPDRGHSYQPNSILHDRAR